MSRDGGIMRVVFFGIHQIGAESLTRLLDVGRCGFELVVTKPGTDAQPQLVDKLARKVGLRVLSPETPKDPHLLSIIRNLAPDLIVVGGYHKVLPPSLLAIPRQGAVNLHASLLPAYRGPVPWKWAIMHGLKQTGVTVHNMVPRLDSGDILALRKVDILSDDTGGSLFDRLSKEGGGLLAETVAKLAEGGLEAFSQAESAASYYSYPDGQQTRVDWNRDAEKIQDLIRALDPSPGAWCLLGARRVRLFGVSSTATRCGDLPGKIVAVHGGGVRVATTGQDLVVERLVSDPGDLEVKNLKPVAPRPGDVLE